MRMRSAVLSSGGPRPLRRLAGTVGRTRHSVIAGGIVVAAGLASCAACTTSKADTAPTPVAQVAATADCLAPQVLAELGLPDDVLASRSPHVDAPAAGRVPSDFVAVSVLACALDGTLRDSEGVWSAVTATRLEGDLDALVTALSRPSTSPTQGSPAACVPPDQIPPVLWLVDAMGRAVRAAWPTDPCGAPQPGVDDALGALQETGSDTYRAVLRQGAVLTG
ncbi:hypothetical protein [Cellulomonas soli]